jgi:hypothetical protein
MMRATARVLNRVKHKCHPQDFIVVSCPDDTFSRGAQFSETAVKLGLTDGCWPDGMTFTKRGARYIVRGRVLVNEGGGLIPHACHVNHK